MKKGILLLLVTILATTVSFAQERRDNWRRPYADIGFSSSTMTNKDMPNLMSNFGISFSAGRTLYLHSKPMLGIARVGIDISWFDVNYTNYKIMNMTYSETEPMLYEQIELGVHVGPSITIRPCGRFNIHGYIKYSPTISSLYANNNIYGGYAPFFTKGVSVSWGNIGVGLELRSFECKYQEMGVKNNPEEVEATKIEGWRAFVTFVF